MPKPAVCPICLHSTAEIGQVEWDYQVRCPICGSFILAREVWDDYLDPNEVGGKRLAPFHRARLSHRIRSAGSENKNRPPVVTADFIEGMKKDGFPGPTPAEQAINAVRYIGDTVLSTGKHVDRFPEGYYAIIGSDNATFAGELLLELRERGLVRGIDHQTLGAPPTLLKANLTLQGWEMFENERKGRSAGTYGFFALRFGDGVLDAFARDVIKPSIKQQLGFDLLDMRDVARAGVIDNIMRTQIRDAAFVVVDLTHDNAGAYWEAGYAEGLGKPVIYICEKAKFDDVQTHFDTNHCTTVPWAVCEPDGFIRELIATLRRSLNLF